MIDLAEINSTYYALTIPVISILTFFIADRFIRKESTPSSKYFHVSFGMLPLLYNGIFFALIWPFEPHYDLNFLEGFITQVFMLILITFPYLLTAIFATFALRKDIFSFKRFSLKQALVSLLIYIPLYGFATLYFNFLLNFKIE